MLSVGITGGIGSGKSTVAQIFSGLGIPSLNADDTAKFLMENDATLKAKIIKAFGEESYKDDRLNRSFLSNTVFQDDSKLALLNKLVHPEVIRFSRDWAAQQETPYIIKESALFFESGSFSDIDFMIGVSTPEKLRIERIISRNGLNEADIMTRISKQMDESEKMDRCDAIIFNDGNHSLIKQVLLLHKKLVALSKN